MWIFNLTGCFIYSVAMSSDTTVFCQMDFGLSEQSQPRTWVYGAGFGLSPSAQHHAVFWEPGGPRSVRANTGIKTGQMQDFLIYFFIFFSYGKLGTRQDPEF